ncbi:E3 ubiquitin-protein ligase HAKAI homolog [Oryza brachyantha]|nr:E3 ubiquitin-protein ligase HAKAI homolog [Oryza brachyantha]
MLQIRLSKIGSSDSGAAAASSAAAGAGGGGGAPPKSASAAAAAGGGPPESVTVACPDHLVIADLPVAKSLGAVTTSAVAAARTIGRRSRRPLGERVHICCRCEFPIALYGRLIPCEHAFCLACARSDSSCYLCDERIQKIQTVKMMEGIFICAAPMCLKSFLKKAEFESHVPEVHANLLANTPEREERNEPDAPNISRASGGDQRQSQMPEMSTARAPPRTGVSPSSSSHMQDREDRSRYHHSRDQTPQRPPMLARPPSFHGRHSYPPGDTQNENPPQGFDRPYNWASENAPGATPVRQESEHGSQDKQQMMPNAPFMFPPIPHQSNFMMPMNMNQPLMSNASFNYPLQQDGNPQFFSAPFQMQLPDVGLDQGSASGVQPAPPGGPLSFPEGLQRPWGMGLMGNPFQSMPLGQGMPEGAGEPQGGGGMVFLQGGFGVMPDGSMNSGIPGRDLSGQGDRGVLAQMPMPMQMQMSLPPPPPTQPPSGGQQPFSRT